jgi:hypothetical protein
MTDLDSSYGPQFQEDRLQDRMGRVPRPRANSKGVVSYPVALPHKEAKVTSHK